MCSQTVVSKSRNFDVRHGHSPGCVRGECSLEKRADIAGTHKHHAHDLLLTRAQCTPRYVNALKSASRKASTEAQPSWTTSSFKNSLFPSNLPTSCGQPPLLHPSPLRPQPQTTRRCLYRFPIFLMSTFMASSFSRCRRHNKKWGNLAWGGGGEFNDGVRGNLLLHMFV